ncbi:unnamed protein product [Heterobilharzia americana]|nr:unnamed protein product [Heterobilharzia americana]
MLNQGIDVSISLYDIMNNDITTSYEKNNTSFGISSTYSTSMNLSSDRLKPKNNYISIQLALKMYLNSPTFLRNCRFNLKRRMITSRNCCPSKMTTTTIPSSSSEYWRLKRVNLKKENNFLSLNNKYEHEQQSVYFVLPPYKLYTLLNVISHNDDFVFQ